MATINMHDAKTQLSDLVARAEAGEEIVIARRNRPAVRLVPIEPADVGKAERYAQPEFAYRGFEESAPAVAWNEVRSAAGLKEDKQVEYEAGALRRALEAGREFTIVKDGKPVAKVVPVGPEPKSRGWGAWEGRYKLPDSFFDPLPDDELGAWDGLNEPAP